MTEAIPAAAAAPVTEVDPNVLPDANVLEGWLMSTAKDSDRSAAFLRRMLQINPGYGRYLSKDQELCGIVELFAKRFRHVVVGAPSPLQPHSLYKPICELAWRVIGHLLSSMTEVSDTNVPVSKEAQGQFKMLLQTNLELSEKLKDARRDYLRELSGHRDKQRKLSAATSRTLTHLEEHPIMFYEPLEFVLDETTKEFVRKTVEERVKLELRTEGAEDVANAEMVNHIEDLEEQIHSLTTDKVTVNAALRRSEERSFVAERDLELARKECEKLKLVVKERETANEELNTKLESMEDTLGQKCRRISLLEQQQEESAQTDSTNEVDVVRAQLEAQLEQTLHMQEMLEKLEEENKAKDLEIALAKAQAEAMTEGEVVALAAADAAAAKAAAAVAAAAAAAADAAAANARADSKSAPVEKTTEKIVYIEDPSTREELDKCKMAAQDLQNANDTLEKELEEERQHVWQLSQSVELLAQEKSIFIEETARRKRLDEEAAMLDSSENIVQNTSDEDIQKAVQEVSMRHEKITQEQQATIDRLLAELDAAHQCSKDPSVHEEKRVDAEEQEKLRQKYQDLADQHEELQSKCTRLEKELAMFVEKLKETTDPEEIEQELTRIRSKISLSEVVAPVRKKAYLRLYEDAERRKVEKLESEASVLRIDSAAQQVLVDATHDIKDKQSLFAVKNLWQKAAAVSQLNRAAASMASAAQQSAGSFTNAIKQLGQTSVSAREHIASLQAATSQQSAPVQLPQVQHQTGLCPVQDLNANLDAISPKNGAASLWQRAKHQTMQGSAGSHANLDGVSPKDVMAMLFQQVKRQRQTMDGRVMDGNATPQFKEAAPIKRLSMSGFCVDRNDLEPASPKAGASVQFQAGKRQSVEARLDYNANTEVLSPKEGASAQSQPGRLDVESRSFDQGGLSPKVGAASPLQLGKHRRNLEADFGDQEAEGTSCNEVDSRSSKEVSWSTDMDQIAALRGGHPTGDTPTQSDTAEAPMDARYSSTSAASSVALQALAQDGSRSTVTQGAGSLGQVFRKSLPLEAQRSSGMTVAASVNALSGLAQASSAPFLGNIGYSQSASSSPMRTSSSTAKVLLGSSQMGVQANANAGLLRSGTMPNSQSSSSQVNPSLGLSRSATQHISPQVGGLASSSPTLIAQSASMANLHPVLQKLCSMDPEAGLQLQHQVECAAAEINLHMQQAGGVTPEWLASKGNQRNESPRPGDVKQTLQAANRAGSELPEFPGLSISVHPAVLDLTEGGMDSLSALALGLHEFGMQANPEQSRVAVKSPPIDLSGILDTSSYGLASSSVGGGPLPRLRPGAPRQRTPSPPDPVGTLSRFPEVGGQSRAGLWASGLSQNLTTGFEDMWPKLPDPNLSVGFHPGSLSQKPLRPYPVSELPAPNEAPGDKDQLAPSWNNPAQKLPLKMRSFKSTHASAPDLMITATPAGIPSQRDGPNWESPTRKSRHKKDRGEAANAAEIATKRQLLLGRALPPEGDSSSLTRN